MNDAFATGFVGGMWITFGLFLIQHIWRVKRLRQQSGVPEQAEHAPASMAGLALEGLGVLVIWAFPREGITPLPVLGFGCLLAFGGVLLLKASLLHLGTEFRIKAVVTHTHRLITTGPYSVVRHPIYAAFLLLAAGQGLVYSHVAATAVGLAIFLAGTEIRIRAEEKLLAQRFGSVFEEYRQRVSAYLPGVR